MAGREFVQYAVTVLAFLKKGGDIQQAPALSS